MVISQAVIQKYNCKFPYTAIAIAPCTKACISVLRYINSISLILKLTRSILCNFRYNSIIQDLWKSVEVFFYNELPVLRQVLNSVQCTVLRPCRDTRTDALLCSHPLAHKQSVCKCMPIHDAYINTHWARHFLSLANYSLVLMSLPCLSSVPEDPPTPAAKNLLF